MSALQEIEGLNSMAKFFNGSEIQYIKSYKNIHTLFDHFVETLYFELTDGIMIKN